eukprot:2123191-Prorocentrum_lima.AAC.1
MDVEPEVLNSGIPPLTVDPGNGATETPTTEITAVQDAFASLMDDEPAVFNCGIPPSTAES